MLSRIGSFFLGLLLIVIPLIRYATGKFSTLWGQSVSPLGDIGFFVFGIILVYITIFKSDFLVKQGYICPNCEETVERTGTKEISCPKCGTKMEKLNGFYERHPELKEEAPEKE